MDPLDDKTGSVGTNMGPKRTVIGYVRDRYGGSKGQYGAVETNLGSVGASVSL